jgi:DNA-directed RNA polymerase specialized sigma24 family protein
MTEPEDRVDLMAPPTPEDPRNSADLLACASDGDATAWEELFRRYNGLVRSTLSSFRLQEADADEAVQNTWLRLAEWMDTIRNPERLGCWLATTASRECLTLIWRRHRTASESTASKQVVTTEQEEPDATVIAEQASTADTTMGELTQRRQHLFYEVDPATGMPQGSIGPTRRRLLRELECTLEQRGFVSQSGTDVINDVYWISREPTEGNRTGSYLLDDLLDKADQALREKLEPKVTDIRSGSTQGTGDAQLDDLLQKADAALRAALHDQGH